MIRYIITDFDGTLVDTKTANKAAYELAFSNAGYRFDKNVYDTLFGLRFNELCDEMGIAPKDRQKIKDDKATVYPQFFNTITLNHGLLSMLKLAKKNGIKIVLASTASRKNINAILEYFGLSTLFDAIVSGEDVQHGKPDGEVYKKAMDIFTAQTNEVLVFEDTEIGVAAAENAGIKNIIKIETWNS